MLPKCTPVGQPNQNKHVNTSENIIEKSNVTSNAVKTTFFMECSANI